MHPSRALSVLTFAALAWLALCVSAPAATVSIGSSLQGLDLISKCGQPCTLIQTALPEPEAQLTSPVTGVVVRWHMVGGSDAFPYRLRVLTPGPALAYTATGSSAPEIPKGPGPQVFRTGIPIQAGQSIGIELQPGAPLSYAVQADAGYHLLAPSLADGLTGTATVGATFEVGYSAEILPAPGVTALDPVSLSAPMAAAAPAPTTAVCVVPSIVGNKLKPAKKRIRNAGCAVGTATRRKGVSAKTGVVVKQNPKAGKILAPGAKVNVKLGQ